MFRTLVVAVALALAAGRPEIPNILEDVITEELRKLLLPLDPKSIDTVNNVNITIDDTSLIFNFNEATLSGFSEIECTEFTPPLITKHVTLSLQEAKVSSHANGFTSEGILNGHPFSGSGAADLNINNFKLNIKLEAASYSLAPISFCIKEGSLDIDLALDSVEANFENADELNDELNSRGPELIEAVQADIMSHSADIEQFFNEKLCV